ncbi:Fe-S cluster assembly protein SufD [Fusibacter sp. 3D3]|uniref:Fe-S cluster assembly protein SufD n=1 Tax=Fusibacter sp. 3D3 TaxID=1048380 RepID=UPI0008537140|nr:Fe-S cluster assembly protein SufD [Fusibacter sp. 3D3]GAU76804.1 iron-sulfur cluster assembly protein SufD [Fusibacter sp. 3D3]
MNFRQHHQDAFNKMETPVWNRVSLPNELFPKPNYKVEASITSDSDYVNVTAFCDAIDSDDSIAQLEFTAKKQLGPVFKHYINGYANAGYVVKSTSKAFKPPVVDIHYVLGGETHTLIDNHVIIAEAGAKLDVIIDYHVEKSDYNKSENTLEQTAHYGMTHIFAKRGSRVRVFKLQRLNKSAYHFDQVFASVEESAVVDVFDVQVGSQFKAISHEFDLKGRHSEGHIKSIYFGDQDSKLDLSFTMNHRGKKSNSSILSKGALDSNALKVFRGNLFFETGASQSVGKEEEFVMLLGDNIKSDSIPALMCAEDDVIGAHAASVGQVDLNKLFYLMSRGFSEIEAKKLVIKASFEEILSDVPYEAFRVTVAHEVDRRVC